MEKEKKPIYKKWWFWVIVVVVLLIIGSMGSSKEQPKTTLTSGSKNNSTENTTQATAEAKKYSIGEIYQDSSKAIKYVSVDENFTGYSKYADIKDGYKIVKADFEAENLGTSDFYFSAYDFDCYADGYDCESFYSVDGSGFSSTLSNGKKAKGAVYFQVPSEAKTISIEFNINTFTGEKVEFIVK